MKMASPRKRTRAGTAAERVQRATRALGPHMLPSSHGSKCAALESLVDARVRFGSKQQALFDRRGFILVPRLLSRHGLAYLRGRVDEIYRDKAAGVDGEWITNVHQLLPQHDNWMWALATHPVILKMVELSLGPGAQIYASQLHRKAPADSADGGGHVVPLHQDGDAKVRTIWICLDAVDQDNGALQVVPGGHLLGRLPLRRVNTVDELTEAQYFARNNVFQVDLTGQRAAGSSACERGDEARRKSHGSEGEEGNGGGAFSESDGAAGLRGGGLYTYKLPAGGAAMHHPLTPHCSPANTSRCAPLLSPACMCVGGGERGSRGCGWEGIKMGRCGIASLACPRNLNAFISRFFARARPPGLSTTSSTPLSLAFAIHLPSYQARPQSNYPAVHGSGGPGLSQILKSDLYSDFYIGIILVH
jgi:hypothetical protein